MRVVSTIKQRLHDDKVILLCESDDREPLVFKYVGRQGKRGAARSHGWTIAMTASDSAPIFPRLYAAGGHWSLEEWVNGPSLKGLKRHEWDDVDLSVFFRRLRHFSRSRTVDATPISEPEIQLIRDRYLRRAVSFMRYQKPMRRFSMLARLHYRRQQFRSPLALFDGFAANAQLPPHLVIDDLNDANILYSSRTAGPVIIDVEDVKPGVLGFDIVWLLTTMARRGCPTRKLMEAYRYVSSDSFLTGHTETVLSRLLFQVLLRTDVITVGGSTSTVALLREVSADLEKLQA